jgi:hypothetical protein
VRSRYGARVDWFDSENILAGDDILDGLGSGLNADGHVIERSRFTFMKVFPILAALALSVAAFGQTPICQSPATGPQPYSEVPGGGGIPTHVPGALNEFLGYIPQAYVALPGMPASPLAFCGPAWQPNYEYAVGNLIELSNGTVLQAISCTGLCKSGATQPPGFSGTLFEPSPVGIWASTCSDPSTTATCDTVDATGTPAPVNFGEPYTGAAVGSTFVIMSYTPNSAYNGSWVVTASTGASPYTVSFTASGLGSGDCTKDVGSTDCVGYQQGSQITDNQVVWQDVGPQNESPETPSFTIAGTAVSLSPGATTGNNSTITVTSVDGFMGMVTLTAAVTSSPAGAQDLPTFSFGSTSPVDLNGSVGTATLTIFTTPATSGALTYPARRGLRWYTASGTGLVAFALLFGTGIGIPAWRRNWHTMLGMLVVLVTLIVIGGLLACGGNGSGGGGGNSGTTPGTYTVTATGTSGSTTATGTITLTVQ